MICMVRSGRMVFRVASLRATVFQDSHRSASCFSGNVLFLPIRIFSHKHSHYTGEHGKGKLMNRFNKTLIPTSFIWETKKVFFERKHRGESNAVSLESLTLLLFKYVSVIYLSIAWKVSVFGVFLVWMWENTDMKKLYVLFTQCRYSTSPSHYTHCLRTISLLKCIAISSTVRDNLVQRFNMLS